MSSYANYKDLVLNKNLFAVIGNGFNLSEGWGEAYGSSTLSMDYNANTGIFTYKSSGTGITSYGTTPAYSIHTNFKLLIIE